MFGKLVLPGRKKVPKPRRGPHKANLIYDDFWNMEDNINMVLNQMLSKNALERTETGKLALRTQPSAFNSPWYYVKHGLNRDCILWHDLYFDHFEIIPSNCMSCWKVVIYSHADPAQQKVSDLFRMRDMLIAEGLPSKCGMDVRRYTPHRYDGFVYGDSLTQGQEHYRIIKEATDKLFPDGRVILKRACTEFEHKHPDSSTWMLSEIQMEMEHRFDSIFDRTPVPASGQDDFQQAQTLKTWIEYAHGIGDTSWREAMIREGYEDPGEHLFPPARTYHELSPEELNDLLVPKPQEEE